jgi:hypothetical protein
MTDKPLTSRQEIFAQGVASGLDQSAAYRKAYPRSLKWKDEAVRVAGAKMMAIGNVSERVQILQAASAELAELDGAEIMREIKRVAMSDIGGIIGPDGKVLMPNELDPATRAAVSSFEIDEYGRVKYKFWDKNVALTNAAKIKGLFIIDNKQKTDGLSDILNGLNGKVLGVTRDVPASESDDESY